MQKTVYGLTTKLFIVNVDALERICADLGIKPDTLLDGLPGADSLREHEPMIRTVAFSAAEARACLAIPGSDPKTEITAAEMAMEMKDALDRFTRSLP